MTFNPIKIIATFFVFLVWAFLAFILMGCSTTSQVGKDQGWLPSGMAEDAQDYPTKYNMMDSPDGSKNPNAQVRIFGATY
jgi:predicted small secreted protein